ncbi:Hachiman antiphage defense system protein HamA [uncultured Helicobacter sp.]|uniref:Hachiman antiphage defense system protein HamA n=1 Tax=uncultured Helicobacter sp. TaxID=175537 RepID=UPI001F8BD01A|nr:Hachiman antiphage defense system protein HamA [uncultured Helicobacter sp.]HIY44478.1 DUF1837 domain-containing protein [Candidatus Helicobacter avistercoris]
MKENLLQQIKDTIVFQYKLPHSDLQIDSSIFSTQEDHCYKIIDNQALIDIICKGIINYSFEEYEIEQVEFNYEALFETALEERFRFNSNASESSQLKYGFYGEVLLHAILLAYFNTEVFISRGHFYDLLSKSEVHGYDSYHIIVKDQNKLELWFGEVKFKTKNETTIQDITKNFKKIFCEEYLNKNLTSIQKYYQKSRHPILIELSEAWKNNPIIKLKNEIKKYDITLVYPILWIYETKKDYDEAIEYIVEIINQQDKDISAEIPYELFFILIPCNAIRDIKIGVLEWIKSNILKKS